MNYFDYMVLTQNRAGQVGALDGTPYAQWATSKDFKDFWGQPTWTPPLAEEVYGIGECGGEQWLTLTRLGPYALKTIKAVVTKQGAVPVEIKCEDGHPYALLNFVPHTIEVWGLIDTLKFYWKANYRQVPYKNPFLGITKDCIEQSEIWGNDDYSDNWSWTRGVPVPANAKPFNGDIPVPIETKIQWFQGIGKGYGPTWVMGEINDAGARTITSCANSEGWVWAS